MHVTDISWTKINNPAEVLKLNQKINVKVLKFDENYLDQVLVSTINRRSFRKS